MAGRFTGSNGLHLSRRHRQAVVAEVRYRVGVVVAHVCAAVVGTILVVPKAHGGIEWSPYYTDVTPQRMAEARGLGLLVGPWGLSDGDDIRRMAELVVYSSTVSGADWGL